MKRYRLKKDLPEFKAGTEFELSKQGDLVRRGEYISDCIVVYSAQTLQKFPDIIKDWFEEMPKQADDLKYGDICYIIGCSSIFSDEVSVKPVLFSPALEAWLEMGEVFLTKEDAEKAIARQKAGVILHRDTKGFKPSRSKNFAHTRVYYTSEGCLKTASSFSLNGGIYFNSHADAEASIQAHEKEWKIYLGVEE